MSSGHESGDPFVGFELFASRENCRESWASNGQVGLPSMAIAEREGTRDRHAADQHTNDQHTDWLLKIEALKTSLASKVSKCRGSFAPHMLWPDHNLLEALLRTSKT